MSNLDLEDVITSSIEDAESDPEPESDSTPEVEASPSDPQVTLTPTPEPDSPEVPSPASLAPKVEPDEFEKKWGVTKESSSGRENRIPYSRVTKIVDKARKEVESTWTPKVTELEAKVKEYEPKVKDYEDRLTKVAEFENVMLKDHKQFLNMLYTIPGYKEIFDSMVTPAADTTITPVDPTADMPQPDQKLSDGSTVYSMEGLKKLMSWQAAQVEAKVAKEFEGKLSETTGKYAPLLEKYQAEQQIQAAIPKIQADIAEARKWPQFNENEADIIKALQADRKLSLEGAYRQVVVPKLATAQTTAQTDQAALRAKMREELLAEIKAAPTSTSAPIRGATRATVSPNGPTDMEEVIRQSIQGLR